MKGNYIPEKCKSMLGILGKGIIVINVSVILFSFSFLSGAAFGQQLGQQDELKLTITAPSDNDIVSGISGNINISWNVLGHKGDEKISLWFDNIQITPQIPILPAQFKWSNSKLFLEGQHFLIIVLNDAQSGFGKVELKEGKLLIAEGIELARIRVVLNNLAPQLQPFKDPTINLEKGSVKTINLLELLKPPEKVEDLKWEIKIIKGIESIYLDDSESKRAMGQMDIFALKKGESIISIQAIDKIAKKKNIGPHSSNIENLTVIVEDKQELTQQMLILKPKLNDTVSGSTKILWIAKAPSKIKSIRIELLILGDPGRPVPIDEISERSTLDSGIYTWNTISEQLRYPDGRHKIKLTAIIEGIPNDVKAESELFLIDNNDPPKLKKEIFEKNIGIITVGVAKMIQLSKDGKVSDYITDPDDDMSLLLQRLTVAASQLQNLAVSYDKVSYILRVEAKETAKAEEKLKVEVEDAKSAKASIELTIKINRAPKITGAIGDNNQISIKEDESSFPIDLSQLAQDPDKDPISWSIESDKGAGDIVDIVFDDKKSILRFVGKKDKFGSGTVTVKAIDGIGGDDSRPVTITIDGINDPPTLKKEKFEKGLGIITVGAGFTKTIKISPDGKVSDYITDPDDDMSSLLQKLTVTASQPQNLAVSYDKVSYALKVEAKDTAGVEENFKIEVEDAKSAKDSIELTVKINKPPKLKKEVFEKGIDIITVGVAKVIKISQDGKGSDYIADPDDDMLLLLQRLTVTASQPQNLAVSYDKVLYALKVEATETAKAEEKLKIEVEDAKSAKDSIELTVKINKAPEILKDIPKILKTIVEKGEIRFREDEAFPPLKPSEEDPIELGKFAQDPDGDEISWSVVADKKIKDIVKIDFNNEKATLRLVGKGMSGFGEIVIKATDKKGGEVSKTIKVIIEGINKPPQIKKEKFEEDIGIITVGTVKMIQIPKDGKGSDYVVDPDPDDNMSLLLQKLTVTASQPKNLDVSYDKVSHVLKVEAKDTAGVEEKLKIEVEDSKAAKAFTELTIKINRAPKISEKIKEEINKKIDVLTVGVQKTIDKLSSYVEDPDKDKLTWTVTASEPKNLRIVLDTTADKLIFDATESARTKENFTIKVDDGKGGIDSERDLGIRINRPPKITRVIGDNDLISIKEEESFFLISFSDLRGLAQDPDGDQISWSSELDKIAEELIEVEQNIEKQGLFLKGKKDKFGGPGTVKLIASDDSGGRSVKEVMVDVKNVDDSPFIVQEDRKKEVLPIPSEIKIKPLPKILQLNSNETRDLNLGDFVYHPDDISDSLVWEVQTKGLSFELKGNMRNILSFRGGENKGVLETITLSVSDSNKNSDSVDIVVKINAVPVLTYMLESKPVDIVQSGFEVNEDEKTEFRIIAMDGEDKENVEVKVGYVRGEKEREDHAKVSWDNVKKTTTVEAITKDWHGGKGDAGFIQISAMDKDKGETKAQIKINIVPVPEPPVIDAAKFQVKMGEDSPADISLIDKVKDDDDRPEMIKWSAKGGSNINVEINEVNRTATFKPKLNWHGKEFVTLIATDTESLSSEAKIDIGVTSKPEAPIIKKEKFQKITMKEDTPDPPKISLIDKVEDDDDRPEMIKWSPKGSNNIDVEINEVEHTATFKSKLDWNGEESVTLRATDSDGQFSEVEIDIEVEPDDDKVNISIPMVDEVKDTKFANTMVKFLLKDVDGPIGQKIKISLIYKVSSSGKDGKENIGLITKQLDLDPDKNSPIESEEIILDKENEGKEVSLIWFSGVGELVNTTKNIQLRVVAVDPKGEKVFSDWSEPKELDNTGRYTPEIKLIRQEPSDRLSQRSIRFKLSVINWISGEKSLNLKATYRKKDDETQTLLNPTIIHRGNRISISKTYKDGKETESIILKESRDGDMLIWDALADLFNESQNGIYTIRLAPIEGGTLVGIPTEQEVEVSVKKEEKAFVRLIPKIVTPNNDKYNEELTIEVWNYKLRDLESFSVEIYDLSGIRLYQDSKALNFDRDKGDGKDRGKVVRYRYAQSRGEGNNITDLRPGLYICLLRINGEAYKATFAVAR